MISIFGQQFLINSLNQATKNIKNPSVFMELVDLVMFLKTKQFNAIVKIEKQVEIYQSEFSKEISCSFELMNSYNKKDIENYLSQMATFINVPRKRLQIQKFERGSTIVEFIISNIVSVGVVLLFINFSLSQVSKTLTHIVKIKKDGKSLFKGKKNAPKKDKQDRALMPISIMINEGNVHYTQINNTVNYYGKEIIKIDGAGEVKVLVGPTEKTVS
jgi:hypothetical protein